MHARARKIRMNPPFSLESSLISESVPPARRQIEEHRFAFYYALITFIRTVLDGWRRGHELYEDVHEVNVHDPEQTSFKVHSTDIYR